MNKTKMIILATAVGSLLAASASAATSTASYLEKYKVVRTDVPLPAQVVSPTLPERYRDQTVQLSMRIDEQGRPQDITLLGKADPVLAQELLPVVRQWRFTPAQKDGQPVARQIVLPLKFV